jgi:hypothetical protein
MRGGADQHRGTAFRDHVVDLGELGFVRAGEFIRQLDLVARLCNDDEMRSLLKRWKTLRIERGASPDQRRCQRPPP